MFSNTYMKKASNVFKIKASANTILHAECIKSSFFQNEINILLFKGNVTHTVLHQNDINSSIQDVIFGVAILDEKKVSSGIRWQDPCLYKKDSGIRKYCIVKKIYSHVIAIIQAFFNSAEPNVLRFL